MRFMFLDKASFRVHSYVLGKLLIRWPRFRLRNTWDLFDIIIKITGEELVWWARKKREGKFEKQISYFQAPDVALP